MNFLKTYLKELIAAHNLRYTAITLSIKGEASLQRAQAMAGIQTPRHP
jgi:hypothetical protein